MAERPSIDAPLATVYSAPDASSEPSNQLLYSESVEVLEECGAWKQIKSVHDGYEGWIEAALKPCGPPTHRVKALRTHLYNAPNYKTAPVQAVYFLSPLTVNADRQDGFARLENGLWIFENHIETIDTKVDDFVETALRFQGTPYLWGGRSADGIDCSGLVQIALMASGINAERDTGQQIKTLGTPTETPARGSLVFFDRHVGIMVDETHILNATARTMDTRIETLQSLIAHYGEPLAIKSIR
ncbi:MAG: C40 family peptidase [Alphaproteobacteria bacterium]|nr:C40 family peptidase [Alphaproteobacteria bacterium]